MPAVAKVFPPPAIFLVTQSPNSVHKDSSSSLLQATGLGLPLPKNQEINWSMHRAVLAFISQKMISKYLWM